MSQDDSDISQGCALTEHRRGSGVAQDMGAIDRRFDPRAVQGAAHDWVTAARVKGRSGALTVVNNSRLQRCSPVLEVTQDGIANFLGSGSSAWRVSFRKYGFPVVPVDIGEPQCSDLAGT